MKTLTQGEFHGHRRDRRTHEGLTLAESEYAPGHRLPLHAHENPFFSLLLRGSFTEKLERGGRRCLPTSLVYYPEHEPHSEAFDETGGRAFNIELGGEWIETLREHGLQQPERSLETRAGRLNWLATRLYREFAESTGSVNLAAEELVLDMVAEMGEVERLGRETAMPPWIERVREVLHERYDEVVRISDLADEAGVHPVHLARVFRRFHGCTVGEYQRRLRVEHACAELVSSDIPLSALAFHTGFSDQAHFTRRFKEVTGVAPGEYRRLLTS